MRTNRFLFTITLFFVLLTAGCLSKAQSAPSEASIEAKDPPFYPAVESEVEKAFRDVPRTNPQDVYQEYNGIKVLQFTVYSSGKTAKMTYNQMTYDIVWVYDATRAAVVQYPLALDLIDKNNKCFPLYQPPEDPPAEWKSDTCDTYLQAIQPILKRGTLLFPALAGDFVSAKGIDWTHCGDAPYCTFGNILSAKYQDYDMDGNLIKRSLRRVPYGWVLVWTWGSGDAYINLPGGAQ